MQSNNVGQSIGSIRISPVCSQQKQDDGISVDSSKHLSDIRLSNGSQRSSDEIQPELEKKQPTQITMEVVVSSSENCR